MLSYGRNKLSNTSSNLGETNGIGRNYKPASRSNSNSLFQGSENDVTNGVDIKSSVISNGTPSRFSKLSLGSTTPSSSTLGASNTSSIPTSPTSPIHTAQNTHSFNPNDVRDARVSQTSTDLEKRIQETLAKHGVEASQNKKSSTSNSYEIPKINNISYDAPKKSSVSYEPTSYDAPKKKSASYEPTSYDAPKKKSASYEPTSYNSGTTSTVNDISNNLALSNSRHVSISEKQDEEIDTSNMYGSSWRRRLDAEDVERITVISCSSLNLGTTL